MISNDTDKEWEKFGKDDPYFGVLSDASFRKGNLNPEALARFFASGEEYVADILGRASRFAGGGFQPRTALDFGCGVGRLAIPLASRCARVVGVDVSPSMLAEARGNCGKMGVANAEFFGSLGDPGVGGGFDFVNSYIVFQHIPPQRGYSLFRELAAKLGPGGVGAVHFTFQIGSTPFKRAAGWLRRRFQPFNMLVNLAKGAPLGSPFMQMNGYRVNDLLSTVQALGCTEVQLSLTDHQGHSGAVMLFRLPPAG